ncbi:FadR/GntR family transcriptional regulator [Rhodoglobus aureus]|uniref:FadR/GntR family transcriptional regulator n=1 Tax=Rhodoglobus aureus TaxID=191497 RepID=A0ABN1VWR9_9MICO
MSSPLYVRAQSQLKNYIRDHNLGPGERLPSEARLAELFGVSRGAMREATRSLQTLGVIKALHGNGLYVAAFSFKPILEQLPYGLADGCTQFTEILQAREALEMGLMPAVAALATTEDLDRCSRLADLMKELEDTGESSLEIDRDFHLSLYASLDNSLVNNLIEIFWELYRRLEGSLPIVGSSARSALLHTAIIEALRQDDGTLAMSRMREHFDDVRARVHTLEANLLTRDSSKSE